MEVRHGICADCDRKYKVPATFKADKAKCKECGGVVHLGPPEGAPEGTAPAPAPAASQPRSKAPAARQQPAAKVAKPAPKTSRTARPARSRTTAKVDAAEAEEEANEPAAGARSRGRAGARSGASGRRGSSARRGSGKNKKEKKKSALPLVLIGLVVILGGAAAWYFTQDDGAKTDEVMAKDADAPASADSQGDAAKAPAGELDGAGSAENKSGESAAAATGQGTPAATEQVAEEEAKPDANDPASVDLSVYDFGPVDGTTDEEWKEMEKWMVAVVDPDSGKQGSNGADALTAKRRKAFPVVLNAMRDIDYSTEDGMRAGDRSQRILMDICNGNNFEWKYTTEPADELFNRKVVRSWSINWGKAESDLGVWAKMAKLKPEELAELEASLGGAAPKVEEADDDLLDDFN